MNPDDSPEQDHAAVLSLQRLRQRSAIALLLIAVLTAGLAALPFLQTDMRWAGIVLTGATFLMLILTATHLIAPAIRHIRQGANALAKQQQDFERLFSASPTAMLLIDAQTLSILRVNQKTFDLTRLTQDKLIGKALPDLLDSAYDANRNLIDKLRGNRMPNEFEVALLDTQREVIESLVSVRAVQFADRDALLLGITNINELKAAQQSLEYYATYDELTGMVNRQTGLMFLEKAMARSWRESSPLTVIFADLDGLKLANDTYGHAEGDRLIRAAANIITGLIRTSDFAVRLGGDGFLMILPNCAPESAQRIADNLQHLLAALKTGDDSRHALYSISCGIAGYAADRHASADELVTEADEKMVEAKQAHRAQRARN